MLRILAEEAVSREVTGWFRSLGEDERRGIICKIGHSERSEWEALGIATALTRDYMMEELLEENHFIEDAVMIRFIFSCVNLTIEEAIILCKRHLYAHKEGVLLRELNRMECNPVIFSRGASSDSCPWRGKVAAEDSRQWREELLGRDPLFEDAYHEPYPRHEAMGIDHGEWSPIIDNRCLTLIGLHYYMLLVEKRLLFNGIKIWRWWVKVSRYDISYKRARETATRWLESVIEVEEATE